MTNLTLEMIEKAKAAKNTEELLALAKENNVELTEEEAKTYFEQLNPKSGELSDDELDNVAGGGCHASDGRLIVTVGNLCENWLCRNCAKQGYQVYGGYHGDGEWKIHTCYIGGGEVTTCCDTCHYCSYEKGLWLCNYKK